MKKRIGREQIDKTEVIKVRNEDNQLEQELRELDIEALRRKLNFEESDPQIIKLIEKIIKEKRR